MRPFVVRQRRALLELVDRYHLELLIVAYGVGCYLLGYRRGRREPRHL